MQRFINEIESLKQELDALKPMDQTNEEILWQKFRLEWNYNSNHIEGNTMTYGDTELLMKLGDEFRAQNNSLKEVNEMRAHDAAIFLVEQWAKDKQRTLIQNDIRELNEMILVKDFWTDAQTPDGKPTRRKIKVGSYKEHPNHVRLKSGEIFRYAEPDEVPIKMGELMDWYKKEEGENPLITAAFLHYKFVLIHPFDDGNGRVSRLLMNYHLLKNDYPPIIIKSKDKANYLYALNQADTGNVNAFIEYLGKQLIWSLKISIQASKGESIEEKDDLHKEIEVWKKQMKSELLAGPRKNDRLSIDLYENNIVKLFDLIEQKALTFEEFFRSKEFVKTFLVGNSLVDISKKALSEFRNPEKDEIEEFRLTLYFKNPLNKSKDENLGSRISIVVKLNVFDYKITIGDKVEKDNYLYSRYLSDYEIDNISMRAIDALFRIVKTACN